MGNKIDTRGRWIERTSQTWGCRSEYDKASTERADGGTTRERTEIDER